MRHLNISSSDNKVRYYILGLLILAILFSFSYCTFSDEMYTQWLLPKKKEVLTAKQPYGTDSEFFLGKNQSDKWSPEGNALLPESTPRELILSWPQGEVSLVSIPFNRPDLLKGLLSMGKEGASLFTGNLGSTHAENQTHHHAINFRGTAALIRAPLVVARGIPLGHLHLGAAHAHAAPHVGSPHGDRVAPVVPAMVAEHDGIRPARWDRGAPPLPPRGAHPAGEGPRAHAGFGGARRGPDPLRGVAGLRYSPRIPPAPEFAVHRDPFGDSIGPIGRMGAEPSYNEIRPTRNLRESSLPGQSAATGRAKGANGGRGYSTGPKSPPLLGQNLPFANPFSLARTPQLSPASFYESGNSYQESPRQSSQKAVISAQKRPNDRSVGRILNINAKGKSKESSTQGAQNNTESSPGNGHVTDPKTTGLLKTAKPSFKRSLAHKRAQNGKTPPSAQGTGTLSDANTPSYIRSSGFVMAPFKYLAKKGSFRALGNQLGKATQASKPQQATLNSWGPSHENVHGKVLKIGAKGRGRLPVQAVQNNTESSPGSGRITDPKTTGLLKTAKPSFKMNLAHKRAQSGEISPSIQGTGALNTLKHKRGSLKHHSLQPTDRQSSSPNLSAPVNVSMGKIASKGFSSAVISDPEVNPTLFHAAFAALREFGGILNAAVIQATASSNPFAISLTRLHAALKALLSAVSGLREEDIDRSLPTPVVITSLSPIDLEGPVHRVKGAIAHLLNAAQRAQILKEEDRATVETLNSNLRKRKSQSLTFRADLPRLRREQEEIEKNKQFMKFWENILKGNQNSQMTISRAAARFKGAVRNNPHVLNDKKSHSEPTLAKAENLPQSLHESLNAFQEAIDKSDGHALYGLSLKFIGDIGQNFLEELDNLKRNDQQKTLPSSSTIGKKGSKIMALKRTGTKSRSLGDEDIFKRMLRKH